MDENNRDRRGSVSGGQRPLRPGERRTAQTGRTPDGQRRVSGQAAGSYRRPVRGQTVQRSGQKEKPPVNKNFVTKRRQRELRRQRIRRLQMLGIAAAALILVVILIVVMINVFSKKAPADDHSKGTTPAETADVSQSGKDKKETSEETSDEADSSEETSEDPSESDEEQDPDSSQSGNENPQGSSGQNSGTDQNSEGNQEGNREAGETVYATVNVNVRPTPDTTGSVLGVLPAGTAITRTANENGWSTVIYQGTTAYISSDFLTTAAPQAETPPTSSTPAAISHSSEWPKLADGSWDLSAIRNDETPIVPAQPIVGFGYSAANRDPQTNIPTDWAYYEKHWGMFNVDWIQQNSFNTNLIYLTMDEGFANTNTVTILDILKEKNVKVAFFITKNFFDGCPDLVQRMLDEGHVVGNHTCTHPSMPTLSLEDQTSQIMTLHNAMLSQFNYEMKLFRFPQGNFTSQSLALVDNLGYKSVFWSYGYNDYDKSNQVDVSVALQNALDALHPGAIYLLHADSDTNMQMLGSFIDGVRARGYEFASYPLTAN